MNIFLNEEQRALLESAKAFSKKYIGPYASQFDKEQKLPKDLITLMAEKKYLSATFPKKYGGLELDPVAYGLLTEEIGKHCNNTRGLQTVHVSLVGEALLKYGSPEQIDRWLPQMVSGEKIAAFALTEPDIGSDAKNLNTSYVKKGNKYIINGHKKWISFGEIAGLYLVVARNEEKITTFLVERETEGVEIKPMKGLLAGRASHIAEIIFKNVIVSENEIIGNVGAAFSSVVATALDHGRYSIAWGGVALAQAALEAMVSYSKKRTQFGEKIRSFQLIKQMIGDAVTEVHAARALCLSAGRLREDNSPDAINETCIAKYFSSKIAMNIAINAVQSHGGNGCCDKYPVERYFRDAKILEIIEGTSQIQQQIISNYGIRKYWISNYPVNASE